MSGSGTGTEADKEQDTALEDSFPASDPPSQSIPVTPGGKKPDSVGGEAA